MWRRYLQCTADHADSIDKVRELTERHREANSPKRRKTISPQEAAGGSAALLPPITAPISPAGAPPHHLYPSAYAAAGAEYPYPAAASYPFYAYPGCPSPYYQQQQGFAHATSYPPYG